MDVAVADEKAAAAYVQLYWLDLLSFRAVRGSGPVYRGLVLQDADALLLVRLDGSLARESVDLKILDRSALHVGQIVVSASDVGGQIGVVTGVTTVLDLAHLNDRGKAKKIIRGVSPSGVRRVRALSLGDYVVSGAWLGRVVEVSLDADIMFDDGAVCRVSDVESTDLRPENPEAFYRPQMNTIFYPRMRVVTGDSAAVFEEARWLNGHWKPDREVGTVVNVEMVGVFVYWIASAQHGTNEQLVLELAPPAYQSPDSLTYFSSAPDCSWGLGDRVFLTDASVSLPDNHHPDDQQQPTAMAVYRTRTTVDVLWQDGTRQHGARSTSLAPSSYMNEHGFFPGQYVVDNACTDDIIDGTTGAGDDNMVATHSGSTARRVGVVRSPNSKDHTVDVSWLHPDNWEVQCDDTVSVYDLGTDPDHSVFYGDVVVRLLSDITGGTPLAHDKSAPDDLSWVGHVVDLHDGHVQVKWGDCSTSTVLPHEISIANKEDYTQLLAKMGDWAEEGAVDATEELCAANMENQQDNPADARTVEGGMIEEGSDGSMNELDGPATTTQNVEVTEHAVTIASHEDPNVGSTLTEGGFALVTRSNASDGEDDSAEDLVVIKATYATRDDDPSKFPRFDIVPSPPADHIYLDTKEQGDSKYGKKWVTMVQKEWKILENSLPDTIYVQAFEDRMDLLRTVIVGARGTPYHNGLFFFDMQLPPSYPAEPPHVYYHSFGLRLNPNLYECGSVCLSLLNTFGGEGTEVWSPGTSSLLQIVVSLQALVLNDQPYYNEAGYEQLVDTLEGHRNALPYSEKAFLLTLRTALHLLHRPPKGFEKFVKDHFCRCGMYVLETCQAYLHGCVATNHGSMKLLCSTGFKIALANLVPRLVTMFKEIGAEDCNLRRL
ncbi:probable ubiquitin-conjugating enzyme E2 23 [Lolium rigidum]|uniref:probable ubiquitin-conjugating enzyme E2 23 n=1 Tax=Lolium rigidum TaxID=89674 RepID=UPI001F5DA1CB|nr:probable ubiquitin-conjugating enzyme E2 23 [Lolium rigidum]